jgi:hypothetical protein
MNYHDNNRLLIEKNLERVVEKMCISCKIGKADWDFNESLRSALQATTCITRIQDLITKYNETFELAKKSNIQINSKYQHLYKLNNTK